MALAFHHHDDTAALSMDEIDASLCPDADAPRRGRPRSDARMVVSVRLPQDLYDDYCRRALSERVPVRTVLRRVLTQYRPPRSGR